MKIGLCMSVIGGGGGNDAVFDSIRKYLKSQKHDVTIFSNTSEKSKLPAFGLLRQLQTINHKDMHNQDLLIFLTGVPLITKTPIIYYHQQMPAFLNRATIPTKYKSGFWHFYYKIFSLIAGFKNKAFEQNIKHFCVSSYLQNQLSTVGIDAKVIYPAISDMPTETKENRIITVSRISPEKNLIYNVKLLSSLKYVIYGNTNRYTEHYKRELSKHLSPNHSLRCNMSRELIKTEIAKSKVYFSSSKETLGLAILEAINANCIPIVVDNTANIETVPFKELRYKENDYYKAIDLVSDALEGNYDYLLPKLKSHISKFNASNYNQLLHDAIGVYNV